MSCKIVVIPHAERKASGEAYKTKRTVHPVSERGWKGAVRQATGAAARGETTSILMMCPRGELRLAQCSDIHQRHGGRLCVLDVELGGNSTRVLAGPRRRRRR